MRLATVFSGIGAIEQAIKKRNEKLEIIFASDTGERYLDETYEEILKLIKNKSEEETQQIISKLYNKKRNRNYVKESYFANYEMDESKWYDDVRFIDGKKYRGQVDLFVGGSPCQSYSVIGKRAGLEDARGTLFYDYARLVKEIKPKVFIYENVPGMLSHDKGNTWKVIKEVFESISYDIHYFVLNSKDFGIPQDRKRLFVVGFKNKVKNFQVPKGQPLVTKSFDYLEKDPLDARFYLGEKGFKFVTSSKYKNRARLLRDIIQTQKANQQFNWNGDFVFVPFEKISNDKEIMKRAFIGEVNGTKGAIRQMTHRECLRLMGFSDDFKIVVPNVQSYRQAGNSIVVNVLDAILTEIEKVVDLNEED